ncbi:hypothetical protein HK101_006524, partial [Irineochytrium annulatum]
MPTNRNPHPLTTPPALPEETLITIPIQNFSCGTWSRSLTPAAPGATSASSSTSTSNTDAPTAASSITTPPQQQPPAPDDLVLMADLLDRSFQLQIRSQGRLFRIVTPFDAVMTATARRGTTRSTGVAVVMFDIAVSSGPRFFREDEERNNPAPQPASSQDSITDAAAAAAAAASASAADASPAQAWIECGDFTEGAQASYVALHQFFGPDPLCLWRMME